MNKSSCIFERPSFVKGFGRAIDLMGTRSFYKRGLYLKMSDYKALKSDWYMVGRDFKEAIKIYEEERRR